MALSTANAATVRWGAWSDDRDLQLDFPAGWGVDTYPPADATGLTPEEIAAAIGQPVGTPALAELAAGKQRACIVIDDLTRPTRGDLLLPPILTELDAAGIAPADVQIIGGVANHRPMLRDDFIRKLGPEAFANCQLLNHFSGSHCTEVGTTNFGTPIEINDDVLAADLRILVGSIIPHGGAGFSGGAKLLMPGVASARSALAYHRGPALAGGYLDVETDARHDVEEAARMVGVDFIVNSVPTSRLGVGAVVAGDVVAAHRAGVERARELLATPTPAGVDVCVLSLYPKDNEFLQHLTAFSPWRTADQPLVREGGTVVVILEASEGFGVHALFGPGMPLEAQRPTRLRDRDVVFMSPNLTPGQLPAAIRDGTTLFNSWDETIAWLQSKHGDRATAAVFPCATMQFAAP